MIRSFVPFALIALFACGEEPAPTDDMTDSDEVEDTEDPTASETDTEPDTDTDTEPDTEPDTDEEEPFTPFGSWTLTGGRVHAVGSGSCPAVAAPDPNGNVNATATWAVPTAAGASAVDPSFFSQDFSCNEPATGDTWVCERIGLSTEYTGHRLDTVYELTITLAADGTATWDREAEVFCVVTGANPSACSNNLGCDGLTLRWDGVKD